MPRLHDGTNHITFRSGGRAVVAAGPTGAGRGPRRGRGDRLEAVDAGTRRAARRAGPPTSTRRAGRPPATRRPTPRIGSTTRPTAANRGSRSSRTGRSGAAARSRPTSGARASAGGTWNCPREQPARSASDSAITGVRRTGRWRRISRMRSGNLRPAAVTFAWSGRGRAHKTLKSHVRGQGLGRTYTSWAFGGREECSIRSGWSLRPTDSRLPFTNDSAPRPRHLSRVGSAFSGTRARPIPRNSVRVEADPASF